MTDIRLVGVLSKRTNDWITLPPNRKKTTFAYVGYRNYAHPYWGGTGVVSGVVKIGSIPSKRKVRLYDASVGVLIREQWSDDAGNYLFDGLRRDITYTVTATDHTNSYNDVIAARVTAV